MVCEWVKCEMNRSKFGRGEEKEVKEKEKIM